MCVVEVLRFFKHFQRHAARLKLGFVLVQHPGMLVAIPVMKVQLCFCELWLVDNASWGHVGAPRWQQRTAFTEVASTGGPSVSRVAVTKPKATCDS